MPVPALYYAATALHTISIPGHWAFGVEHVDKAVDQIPPEEEYSVGRAGTRVSWASFHGLLATLGLLNYQWAKRGGARTAEEKLIVLSTLAIGLYAGRPYFKARAYSPLGCIWVAPLLTAIATFI
ncbi:unnamed protein product [Clonostachys byssicola]|uniref:Uncharacterized protein n=1 Tax=Clonostachys byssicola TaxID=160290 RepID=A0A9N9UFZ6_9HYPO|nr:unnamed protein product [Clonostachys byssicola]